MSRWQRYWFADGGRHAAAVVRVAIAASVLLSLWRLWSLDPLVAPGALYRPVGVWMVMGRTVPPDALIALLWVLAWGGTVCMLVGFYTRASTAVSFGASIALAAISFSGSATWSHQYNVVFLAQCAFLGARSGDVWSVDALIRKKRGLPSIKVARGYQWSLRLVQLAVALMFAGAVFHKLLHGHGTLRWALSDNLRHHLLVRFDLAGLDRPFLVEWIIDDVWRYRGAALLNMITQLAPLIAVIFVRRPWVRALGGLAFVTETIALGLVISLWNLHWLPLVAVFIDWDALLGTTTTPPPPADWKPPRRPRIFIIAFVIYEVVTSFIPTLDQRLNTFPFSGFPMFATIRAKAPYGDHHDYVLPGDHIEPIGSTVHKFAQRWLDHSFRGLHNERDPERIKAKLAQIVEQAPSRYPDATIKGVRAYLMLFVAPAYPARAHFEPHPVAVTGELHPDGTFKTLLGTLDGTTLTLRPREIDTTTVELAYYADDQPTRIPITGATRNGDAFTLPAPLPGKPLYVVATVGDTTWLVASRK
ncbi:MAG: hypothetical protein H0T46_37090 [Deltaproteobacteria bacterium]|nr:hypothetical protein [Deltaproteobacteria bacterium]